MRGMLASKCRLRNIARLNAERLREVLEKRPTAARAGLVHHDVAHDAVFDPHGLHILTANVENEARIGNERARGTRMGDRLDRMAIGRKCAREQIFSVASHAHTSDIELNARRSVSIAQSDKGIAGNSERLAFVGRVKTVNDLAVVCDKGELGRSTARINAEPHAQRAIRITELTRTSNAAAFRKLSMARLEIGLLFRIREQRRIGRLRLK